MQLRAKRVTTLVEAQAKQPWSRGRTGWKTTQELGLLGASAVEWNCYATILVKCFIHLEEDVPEKLIQTNNGKDRNFYAKLGYEAATLDE